MICNMECGACFVHVTDEQLYSMQLLLVLQVHGCSDHEQPLSQHVLKCTVACFEYLFVVTFHHWCIRAGV